MSDSHNSFVWGTDGRVPLDSDDSTNPTLQVCNHGFDDTRPLDNLNTTDLRMHDCLFPGMAKDVDFGSPLMPVDSVRRLSEFANSHVPPLAQELSSLRTRARGEFVYYRPPGPVSDESQAHSSFIPGHAVDMAPVAGLLTPSYYEPHITGSITQPYPTTRQFENELVATHDDAAPLSAHSSGAVTTGNDKRNLKRHIHSPVSAFRCQHKGCSYSAASNKDLKRHLQSRKHRNAENTTEESATETYRCLAPGCKFAEEGCYRLDNLMRHIKTVHYRRGSPAEEGVHGWR
ncbi:hypothetical protein B0T22DRAFT_518933 [Podospora appendiculata]|uniref:C2H2-type domain-containing protein n=1 Tax=Podospora appendiculata TaxID=314037 RepID=A0AAE0WYC4_9PEZI|nr:hypothetical protein B0T22DRAFT_518933 [Podospora appendiculata]